MATGERANVLRELFPRPPRHASLRYDHESQRYLVELDVQAGGQAQREDVCAVCLDPIEDNCVASGYACEHTYHYDCLLDWVQYDHDDCPQCRRLLWSPLEYDIIARQLRQGPQSRSQSPQATEGGRINDTNRRSDGELSRESNPLRKLALVLLAAIVLVAVGTVIEIFVEGQHSATEETVEYRCSSFEQSGYTLESYYFSDNIYAEGGGHPDDHRCALLCHEDQRCNSWMSRDSGCFLSEDQGLVSLSPLGDSDISAFTFNSRCCEAPEGLPCLNPLLREGPLCPGRSWCR